MTLPPLREAFDAYKTETLSVVLTQAGVPSVPKTKEDKISLWILVAPDRKRIERSLSLVTPRCRKALELLQAAGGEMRTSRYESLLTRAGLLDKQSKQKKPAGRWATADPDQADDPVTFQEVLASLVKHGLVWTHTIPGGGASKLAFDTPGRFVVILPVVAPHLPPPPKGTDTVREVPHNLEGSARTCQRDLYLVWSTARETPFQAIASGLLRLSDLKRLSGHLLIQETIAKGAKESDYRRLFFLRRLAEKLDMLQWKNERGVYHLGAKADPAFLHVEPAQRVRNSFLAWRDGNWWNELWATYVPGLTRANGTLVDMAPPKVVEARQTVLNEIVRRAANGEMWIWLDGISLSLSMRNENFLVDRALADAQRPMYYGSRFVTSSPYLYNSLLWTWEISRNDEELGWRSVEEVFIRSVVAEGLYWLGLVDLGYRQPQTQIGGAAPANVVAIRLTEMGRWLLTGGPQPAVPEEAGRVVIQPNFRIFAFDPIADRVLARLDTFATRLNAERAIEYEVTRDTIYRALLAGQNVNEIKSWLVGVSGNPIPQNVERNLDEWQAAFDRIVIRRHVAVIQAATPELIDTLLEVKSIHKAIIAAGQRYVGVGRRQARRRGGTGLDGHGRAAGPQQPGGRCSPRQHCGGRRRRDHLRTRYAQPVCAWTLASLCGRGERHLAYYSSQCATGARLGRGCPGHPRRAAPARGRSPAARARNPDQSLEQALRRRGHPKRDARRIPGSGHPGRASGRCGTQALPQAVQATCRLGPGAHCSG